MGCDIHCYVEHKDKNSDYWQSFGQRMNPGRHYGIFGRLAGVRSDDDSLFPMRGIPDDMGFWANDDYWLYITDTEGEKYCTKAQAEEYHKHGCKYRTTDGARMWIQHPDWHSPSWVTPAEWKACTMDLPLGWMSSVEWGAVYAAMKYLEDAGQDVRCVFWFDN